VQERQFRDLDCRLNAMDNGITVFYVLRETRDETRDDSNTYRYIRVDEDTRNIALGFGSSILSR
jgi:hypothetical protein